MFNKNYKIIKAESLDVGVLEVEYKGQLFTRELMLKKHEYAYESSPVGLVWCYANEKGQVIKIKKVDYINYLKEAK
jgi:hypothetical protein